MAGVSGKWRLTATTNLEAYHNAIHTSEEYKNTLRKIAAAVKEDRDAYWEVFIVDGSTVKREVYIKGEKKREATFTVGKETDSTNADGRSGKITVTVESPNKVVIHEKLSDADVSGVIEAKGSELTISLSGGGVTSVQTYEKI